MFYRVFDLLVESEIGLLDFEQVVEGAPALRLTRASQPIDRPAGLQWTDVRRPGSEPGTLAEVAWSVASHDHHLLMVVPRCGAFSFDPAARRLACEAFPDTNPWVLSSQLSANLVPRVLGELGQLVVHASAVVLDRSACVLFIGPSRAGKSTLAASFARNGAEIASDDCVLLRVRDGRLVAFMAGGVARLWDDSLDHVVGSRRDASVIVRVNGGRKWSHRFDDGAPAASGWPVRAIFDLSPPAAFDADQPCVSPESWARLLARLTDGMLLLGVPNLRERERRFQAACDVANACPAFFGLQYPRRFERLPDVRRTIHDAIDGSGGHEPADVREAGHRVPVVP